MSTVGSVYRAGLGVKTRLETREETHAYIGGTRSACQRCVLSQSLIAQLSVERIVVPEPDDGFYPWFHYIGTGKRQTGIAARATRCQSPSVWEAFHGVSQFIQANVVVVRLGLTRAGRSLIPPPEVNATGNKTISPRRTLMGFCERRSRCTHPCRDCPNRQRRGTELFSW